MREYIKRMEREYKDLKGKTRRAENALLNKEQIKLDKTQHFLLNKQLGFMEDYLETLKSRIGYEKKLTEL